MHADHVHRLVALPRGALIFLTGTLRSDERLRALRRSSVWLVMLSAVAFAFAVTPALAQEDGGEDAVVRGVFFFSPTCGHCELVIKEHLPGIFETYGGEPALVYDKELAAADVAFYLMTNGTLELLFVDVTSEAGAMMFTGDGERLGLEQQGVPRVDIGEIYLTGSVDIPERLPGIIEAGLAGGGISWPAVPGVDDALSTIPGSSTADPSATSEPPAASAGPGADAVILPTAASESIWDRIGKDPVANGLAIVVLVGMLVSLVLVPALVLRGSLAGVPAWLVPVLAGVGIGVSAYLGSVETSGAEAICGPVGDCNTVQQSEYAAIVGVPIGVIGLVAYAVLLVAWVVSRVKSGRIAAAATVLVAAIALAGTLFSIYLTFLEPFVIGATCMWCLTSAVTITGLFWATAGSGFAALTRIRGGSLSPA